MCGIAGWVSFCEDVGKKIDAVRAMQETLIARGPDGGGVYVEQRCALAHRRLAVVDILGGAQPMSEGAYTLIYNGELYNTDDVRSELASLGWEFRGHSDTEVLLKSYVQWGEDCLAKLRGIFAFAVWNSAEGTLFAARDRAGVKPLFYYEDGRRLVFGSTIHSLSAAAPWCGGLCPCLDAEGRRELFLLGPGKKPDSGIFKNYRELRPGECLTYSERGLSVRRYWSLTAAPHELGRQETIDRLRAVTESAVKRQLVSDVPLCCMLSGGLDSSILSALAAKHYRAEGRQLTTWSVDYTDNSRYFRSGAFVPSEDAPYARQMSQLIGSDHRTVTLSNTALADVLVASTLERGWPGMADVDSSLYLFCREIRRGFTVGLSGECADELMGGYPWYHRPEILFEQCFPWSRTTDVREALLTPEAVGENPADWLRGTYEAAIDGTDCLPGESAHAVRMRQMFRLNYEWFMQTLLSRKDAMSMAWGLEMRVPFADEEIVELAYNLPWELKSLDGREKGLMRKAFEDILTPDVAWRKKSPYPKTYHPDYLRRVNELLLERLNDRGSPLHGLVNGAAVAELMRTPDILPEPWYGQLMRGPQVLAWLLTLDGWLREYRVELV